MVRLRPVHRWAVASAVAAGVAIALPAHLGWAIRLVAAWDAALLILLGEPWAVILRSDSATTRRRAAAEDPGLVGVFFSAVIASIVSLLATVQLVRRPTDYAGEGEATLLLGLALVAVAGGWLLLHTSYTLRYAHLHYAAGTMQGMLVFPGEEPDDLDFAYFAFTVGMTYQVSDVTVAGGALRRVVLAHALLSFIYNTAILALAVTLSFGRLT